MICMILSWNCFMPPKDFKLQIYWFWEKLWTKTLPGKINNLPVQKMHLPLYLDSSPLFSRLTKRSSKVYLSYLSGITQKENQRYWNRWFRLRASEISGASEAKRTQSASKSSEAKEDDFKVHDMQVDREKVINEGMYRLQTFLSHCLSPAGKWTTESSLV